MCYDTENICSLRKDEKDLAGCYSNYNLRASSVKRCSQVCWKGSGHSPGLSYSSIALQGITICSEFSPPSLLYTRGHGEEIQLVDQDQCGEQGRSCMVESSQQDNSEYPNPTVKTIRSHQIRCFKQGLGSSAEQSNSNGRFWLVQEMTHHISYLEILAAFLAIKAFGRSWRDITVLIRMDNYTAVTYINQ